MAPVDIAFISVPHAAHIPLSAILLVIAATACFTSLDVIVKTLSQRYPVPLLVWARYAIQAVLMIAVLAPRMRWDLVRTSHPVLMIVRGITLLVSSLFFFSALRFLPLAEATALNYSTPMVVTLAAGAFLHERITRPRWAFVIAGFIGMLLIVRPGMGLLGAPSLLALGAAMFYASFQILTRKLAGEDARALLFYPALCGGVLMTAVLPWFARFDGHASFPPLDMLLILAIGVIGTVGHFLFIPRVQARAGIVGDAVHLYAGDLVDARRLARVSILSRRLGADRHGRHCRQRLCADLVRALARGDRCRRAGGRRLMRRHRRTAIVLA